MGKFPRKVIFYPFWGILGMGPSQDSARTRLGLVDFWLARTRNLLGSQNSARLGLEVETREYSASLWLLQRSQNRF